MCKNKLMSVAKKTRCIKAQEFNLHWGWHVGAGILVQLITALIEVSNEKKK